MRICHLVIIDDDAKQVYEYFQVNEFDLVQICEKHRMKYEDVWNFVSDSVNNGAHTIMFQLPLFNQHHPKEN